MDFFYPIHIPSLDSPRYFKEFTCKHFKAFVKIILNNNDDAYELFIDELIEELCREELDISQLTNFDKFVIMLEVRAINISPIIEFSIPKGENEKIDVAVDLFECLNIARSYDIQHSFDVSLGELTVTGTLPKKLVVKDWFDVSVNCITSIEFNGKKIPVCELDGDNKKKVINQLPAPIFSKIVQQFNDQATIMQKEHLTMFPSIDGSEDLQPVYISPVDNTMSQLIKVFYNYNLKDMYSGQISLMSELKIPDTFIDKSTPAELSVYYSIIEQHAKEREAEMEQDDTVKNPMPKPPQGID